MKEFCYNLSVKCTDFCYIAILPWIPIISYIAPVSFLWIIPKQPVKEFIYDLSVTYTVFYYIAILLWIPITTYVALVPFLQMIPDTISLQFIEYIFL